MFLQAKRLLFSSIPHLDKKIIKPAPINIKKKKFSSHYEKHGIITIVRKYNIGNKTIL